MKKIVIGMYVCSLVLQSCAVTYGDLTESSALVEKNIECTGMSRSIHLHFDGEPLDFTYTRLGMVETLGGENASKQKVLEHLAYEAWNLCANGLILIKNESEEREFGIFLDFKDEYSEYYIAEKFSALAVSIDKNEDFVSKYGTGMDSTFIARVEQDKKSEKEYRDGITIVTVMGLLAAGIVALFTGGL